MEATSGGPLALEAGISTQGARKDPLLHLTVSQSPNQGLSSSCDAAQVQEAEAALSSVECARHVPSSSHQARHSNTLVEIAAAMVTIADLLPSSQGLLPYYMILVSLISVGNSAQCLLTLHFTRRIYCNKFVTNTSLAPKSALRDPEDSGHEPVELRQAARSAPTVPTKLSSWSLWSRQRSVRSSRRASSDSLRMAWSESSVV
ncbi:hypothetical protein BN1723_003594, partial [Verticillium longisporum]